ncbi:MULTISPECIES: DUF5681 domain-containing protein [unclassified Methylobacterium]|uniref:DUF5681 domain-containing protein n=1 Tax=unclassified Methylobacterium TaxID=2615210 RepID=UPI0011C204B0|nr:MULTISPECIES: DUF5681 domain-containing protein [unclassified Methylobacterium]QEE41345.1 hypothetical protein FVA80_22650 [Methylobacterium sp. WL1]TXN57775.1 hypothetical protein FV241_09965 [Methylobacterium sp. WL2]
MARDRERGAKPADTAPIGYGRPPEAHRFKPGGVGNPWGRKGKPKPTIDFFDEIVTVPVGGKPRRMTRDETIDLALYRELMGGNVSASKEMGRRRKERQANRTATSEDDALSPEDQAAFDRMIERRARGLRSLAGEAEDRCEAAATDEGARLGGDDEEGAT